MGGGGIVLFDFVCLFFVILFELIEHLRGKGDKDRWKQ